MELKQGYPSLGRRNERKRTQPCNVAVRTSPQAEGEWERGRLYHVRKKETLGYGQKTKSQLRDWKQVR